MNSKQTAQAHYILIKYIENDAENEPNHSNGDRHHYHYYYLRFFFINNNNPLKRVLVE